MALVGGAAATAFAVLGVVTMASMSNAGLLAASRFPFAMGRERLLPAALSFVHPRFLTPWASIVLTGGVMAVAIAVLDVEGLAKAASTFVIMIFALENAAVIVLRESGAQWYQPAYRSPLYPTIQLLGIVGGIALLAVMGLDVVVAAFVTVAVPGALLFFLYGKERAKRRGVVRQMGRRTELVTGEIDPETLDLSPTGEAAVTVALFGWERSPEALVEVGIALAGDRSVEMLHLTEVPEQMPTNAVREEDPAIRSLRRRIRAMAEEKGTKVRFDAVISRDLIRTAHEVSSRLHCEWLVMAWRQ